MDHIIELQNVTKTYQSPGCPEISALGGISLSIDEGEYVSICGVSGTGKSTLLHIIGGIDKPTTGNVIVKGIDIANLNERDRAKYRNAVVGIVLQEFALIPHQTAYDNVMVPLYFSENKRNKRDRIMESLDRAGVADLANRKVSTMSGGQRQRVAIARAIVNDAPIILADEPTGQLDVKTKREISDLLLKFKSTGKTIIMVTHDLELAKATDRTIRIVDGKTE